MILLFSLISSSRNNSFYLYKIHLFLVTPNILLIHLIFGDKVFQGVIQNHLKY